MTTKTQTVIFGIIATVIVSIGLTTTQIEALEEVFNPQPTMILNDPFSFNLPTSETLRASYEDVNRSTPIADLAKGSTIVLPIQIDSIIDEDTKIEFHATYGGQKDIAIMPEGISAKIVPDTISLKAGESQIINLEVTSTRNTDDATYLINIIGWYGETENDFKGTAVKINVGQSDGTIRLAPGVSQ